MNVVKTGVTLPVTDEMLQDVAFLNVGDVIARVIKYPMFERVKPGLYHGHRLLDDQNMWRIQRSGGPNGKYWYAYRRRHHDAPWEHVRVGTHNRATSLKLAKLLVRQSIDEERKAG